MPASTEEEETLEVSPNDAFAVLGDETRLQILRTLGEADGPLSFTELHDRVAVDDSGNFNYHLNKLRGHFLRVTDDGYTLRQAGKRVLKAVLSGVVTENPILEPTHPSRWSCPYCGAPAEIGYDQERVWTSCPECGGTYGGSVAPGDPIAPADHGFIGHARLPPAGLEGQTAREVLEAAATWGHLDFLAMASGICSRCAATVTHSVNVCEEHGTGEGLCDRCDCRHAVQLHARCTNCIHEEVTPFVLGRLIASTELLEFLAIHGINPVSPSRCSEFYRTLLDYDEEVLSTDPFEARFTLAVAGDELAMTVADDLSVVDVTKRERAPSG